jgi:hypothetical protein
MNEDTLPLEVPVIKMTPAERMYKTHCKNVLEYQRRNPEKMKEKQKRYYEKMKTEKP